MDDVTLPARNQVGYDSLNKQIKLNILVVSWICSIFGG